MTDSSASTKSGLRSLKPGEILFNDGEHSDSLFIIQKGQIRLYKPKGKGFIELAVLRSGEVIGEMAYFDEDGSGKRRSCSASALTPVDVIEISFTAFGKTMESLNPWFKTIINTLVSRLKKTNSRVKELEDNQTSNYNTKGYEFLKPIEVMRILGTLFLVFKAHGEAKNQTVVANKKALQLYTADMYQIMDVKLETVLAALVELNVLEIEGDVLTLKNIEFVRQVFIFYNSERTLVEDKKLKISEKSEQLITSMVEHASSNPPLEIPNLKIIDDIKPKFMTYIPVTPLVDELANRNIMVQPETLEDGRNVGMFGDLLFKSGMIYVEVDFSKVQKLYPVIRFMNAIRRINIEKSGGTY
jgi:CRP/FNR family transcriptional regulator, cyclic AMP receptor protein